MWILLRLSWLHENLNELLSRVTVLEVLKLWADPNVIVISPVAGSYVAPVGVNWLPPVTLTALASAPSKKCVLYGILAVTTAPYPPPPALPTPTVIVSVLTEDIARVAALAGSDVRG